MSHARKHVTHHILTQDPVPSEQERIVRVVEARGSNVYQVEYPTGQKALCLRPSKFRNIVWIKRGDYLVIHPEPDDPQDRSKIRSIITNVLYPDHIRNLKSKNLWPAEFDVQQYLSEKEKVITDQEEGGSDDELQANPNRRPVESASDESGESDED